MTARDVIEAELKRVAKVLGHPDLEFRVWWVKPNAEASDARPQ